MVKIERTITIAAPVERVSAYLTEPANWPEFWPSMVECRGTQRSADGTHYAKSQWTYKMAGLRIEGVSDTTEYIPNRRIVSQGRGGIENTTTWEFQPAGAGTRVDLTIEYAMPGPLLGKFAESIIRKVNEHEADTLMANLKARLEG